MHIPVYIAASGLSGLFTALGINLRTFILDGLAFLVVVFILGRYVYPPLIKAIDGKMAELEAASRLKSTAEAMLEKTHAQADSLIAAAQDTASDIVSTAHTEADGILAAARLKAAAQADRIVSEAREELVRDVEDARYKLRREMVTAVADATEQLTGEHLTAKMDDAMIERTLAGKR